MSSALNGALKNTCIGSHSGSGLTTGNNNVLVGFNTANGVTSGGANTVIGTDSAPANEASAANQILIGYGVSGTGDNFAVIGNASITRVYANQNGDGVLYANGTINTSDARFKKNVEDTDLGLEFINKIRPVKYDYKETKDDSKKRYGIIAQEVLTVLKDSGNEDFAGIQTEDQDKLGADYIQFVAPLIKAVQELSAKVKALEDA